MEHTTEITPAEQRVLDIAESALCLQGYESMGDMDQRSLIFYSREGTELRLTVSIVEAGL